MQQSFCQKKPLIESGAGSLVSIRNGGGAGHVSIKYTLRVQLGINQIELFALPTHILFEVVNSSDYVPS